MGVFRLQKMYWDNRPDRVLSLSPGALVAIHTVPFDDEFGDSMKQPGYEPNISYKVTDNKIELTIETDKNTIEKDELIFLLKSFLENRVKNSVKVHIELSLKKLSNNLFVSLPRVLNQRYHELPKGAIYIGRGSPYGNPYSCSGGSRALYHVSTRGEALQKHKELINSLESKEMQDITNVLKGKDLVCFCKPSNCHGDYLVEVVN